MTTTGIILLVLNAFFFGGFIFATIAEANNYGSDKPTAAIALVLWVLFLVIALTRWTVLP